MDVAQSSAPNPGQPWRILVVEDDPGIRRDLAETLGSAGHTIDVAADGQSALARLRQGPPPDLILLDLVMPRLDGWELRAAQLASPGLADIPVLAMSGEDSAQARAVNAQAYLAKPFGPRELLATIDRLLLAEECRRLQVRLRESERLVVLGTIAAELGHEINNPLTCILHNLAEVERGLGGPEQESQRLLVQQSLEGAQRIHHLVATLGTMSRKDEEGPTTVELAVVLETAITMTSHHFAGRARLVRDLAAAPTVWGNEPRLGQLFINLLANAAQAMPPGRPDNEVRITATADGEQAVVEIRDNGVGMTDEVRQRLFEPFFTTKGPGKGTGLGLVISRDIVRDHGGRLDVDSRPGAGTTVRVTLPVHDPLEPDSTPGDDVTGPPNGHLH
jgi:signal transduction histidine kinase